MDLLSPADFRAVYGFRRPDAVLRWSLRVLPVCGLDYPFTISRRDPGRRCRPSSLYTFPA